MAMAMAALVARGWGPTSSAACANCNINAKYVLKLPIENSEIPESFSGKK